MSTSTTDGTTDGHQGVAHDSAGAPAGRAAPLLTDGSSDDRERRAPTTATGRRRWRLLVALAATTASASAGVVAWRASTGSTPAGAPAPARPAKTAPVVRMDLVERVTVDGTLGYGDPMELPSPRQGTVTWLPDVGATVERGQPLARVDGHDVPLLYGTVPLYRRLEVGVTDGDDVRQIEENLVALGHGVDGLTVDGRFDWATREAVRSWQRSAGRDATGVVSTDEAVFAPAAMRVAQRKASVGQRSNPGQPLVSATVTDRSVTVDLDVSRQSLVSPGDAVQIELPDHRVVGGHVATVSTVAEVSAGEGGGDGGTPKIPLTITIDDPASVGRLDQAPVSVRITERAAANVLAVPVSALVALHEGGYAVEVVRDGVPRYVAVRTGAFAGGHVEVSGDVTEGDTVVVAS